MNENDRESTKKSHEGLIALLAIIGFVVTATAAVLIIYYKFRSMIRKLDLRTAFEDIDLEESALSDDPCDKSDT